MKKEYDISSSPPSESSILVLPFSVSQFSPGSFQLAKTSRIKDFQNTACLSVFLNNICSVFFIAKGHHPSQQIVLILLTVTIALRYSLTRLWAHVEPCTSHSTSYTFDYLMHIFSLSSTKAMNVLFITLCLGLAQCLEVTDFQ